MQKQSQIIVTCNTKQAEFLLEALKKRLAECRAEYEKYVAAGKQGEPAAVALKKEIEGINSALRYNQENLNRVKAVMDNLAGSSLTQLRGALKDLKKQLNTKSENNDQLVEVQRKMKAITDQMKIVEGSSVNVEKGLKNLSSRSDEWLTKAIAKTKDLVAASKPASQEYEKQQQILQRLTAEQSKRTYKFDSTQITAGIKNLSAQTDAWLAKAITKQKELVAATQQGTKAYAQQQENLRKLEAEQSKRTFNLDTSKIAEGMKSLSAQTDAWLNKAIAKQKELVAATQQGTQAYAQQAQVLQNLQAEQSRRSVSAIQTRGEESLTRLQAAQQSNTPMSKAQLADMRQSLVNYRDNIGVGGIDKGGAQKNAEAIRMVNAALKEVDAQIDVIHGKERQIELTADEIAESVKKIDFKNASPNELKAKLDEVNRALAQMVQNDPMRKGLVQSAKKLQQAIEQVDKEVVDVDRVLRNLKKAPLDQLKAAAAQLEQEMVKLDRDTKEYANNRERIRKLKAEIDKVNNSVKTQEGAWRKTFSAISAYMGVTMIIGKAQQMLSQVINLNLKFSDQLADIRKVSGLAAGDIDNLANRLAKVDTRTTIEELNQIAYAGAKLGIGKYGVEGLEGFTKASNQVNVALKEDLGADALTALSKITEVMGLIPKMGVEKSMLATGSAMFQLSATSTATANNIVEFSKRLTGMARNAGITTDQLLALGSASDSMFLAPEVASTAFNKFIASLQTKHNLIEKQLEIDPGTISKLYESGKIVDAMVLVFEKMREKGGMNALQPVFKDLGSEGARLVNVMVTMSQNVDMLKDHLYTAEEAFEEATAVTNEYNIQQETAQALMERASNLWEKAFVNPEGVDNVKGMAQAWYDMSKAITESEFYMGQIKVILGGVLLAIKMIIHLLPEIFTFVALRGLAAAYSSIRFAIGQAAIQLKVLKGAQLEFNRVAARNVWLLIATGLITAVQWLQSYGKEVEKINGIQQKLTDCIADFQKQLDDEAAKIKSYLAALENSNTTQKEREKILHRFNKEYRPYLDKLGGEIKSVNDLRAKYVDLNGEIKKKLSLQMAEKAKAQMLSEPSEDGKPSIERQALDSRMAWQDFIKENPLYHGFNAQWVFDRIDENVGFDRATTVRKIADSMKESIFKERGKGLLLNDNVYQRFPDKAEDGIGMNGSGTDLKFLEVLDLIKKMWDSQTAVEGVIKDVEEAFGVDQAYKEEVAKAQLTGPLENEAPDKDAIKEANREKREIDSANREKLEQAKDESGGIISNLVNFYKQQIDQLKEDGNDMGMDEALVKRQEELLTARMNAMLAEARKAMAGEQNNWAEVKESIIDDLRVRDDELGYNESRNLYDKIVSKNIDALHEQMLNLSKSLGMSWNSIIEDIYKKATINKLANSTAEQRYRLERDKIKLQDDYTGTIDNQYSSSMTRLGFFDMDEQQTKASMAGGEAFEKFLEKRAKEIEAVFKTAREHVTDLIAIGDVSMPDGRNQLLTLLFGEDWDQASSELRNVFDAFGEDLQQFYAELIKYTDDYTEAQKRASERKKKLIDFQYNNSAVKQSRDEQLKINRLYSSGILQHVKPDEAEKRPMYGVYGNGRYMPSFGVDPEVERYKILMEAAQDYYNFMKAHTNDTALLREQEEAVLEARNQYLQSIAGSIKSQMDSLLELTEPIQDFGTAAGDALALMSENAEEGRAALKAAVGDMIKSLLKQTVEITKDYLKRQIMQKAHDRITSLEAKKHEAEMAQIEQQGGNVRTALQQSVQEGISEIGSKASAERVQTNVSENMETVQSDAKATGAKVPLGIAAGAAKTIGSLGWWGIPLVAVLSALLNALLGAAMSKVSSLFGGKASTESTVQTKLVSGMLTYDSGNVQAFRGVEDGKTYPVVGSDGKVYAAKDGGELSTGLIEDPITTFVNGQPALVAERGPEMVIGRETTAAMMMARPDILAEIVKFDRARSGRTYRAFDSGNIDNLQLGVAGGLDQADVIQLRDTIGALATVLDAIQRNGISARINKFGRGGVTDEAESGRTFMRRNSGDRKWR